MMPNGEFRIFSRNPVKDRVEIFAERAGKKLRDAKKAFGRYANNGADKLCIGIWKFLDAEERAEKALEGAAKRQVAKARALAFIFAVWRENKDALEYRAASGREGENGLPKPPREGGVVFQDASIWYNECGRSRYSVINSTNGTGAVHAFYSEQGKPQ